MVMAVGAPVAAQPNQGAIQRALIGVVVQAVVQDIDVLTDSDVDILNVTLQNSLNNLLRDADIDVNIIRDSLNNVLRNVDVTIGDITVVDGDLIIQVLSGGVTDLVVIDADFADTL